MNPILSTMLKPTSAEFIKEWLTGATVLSYKEFADVDNIEDVLTGKYKCCVFLYHSKPTYGHWCCVFRRPFLKRPGEKGKHKRIEVFDSYGVDLLQQLRLVPESYKAIGDQKVYYLDDLLDRFRKEGGITEYSDVVLQGPYVATCGRHCINRILNKKMSIDKYANVLFKKQREEGIIPDEWVCLKVPDN